MPNYFYTDKFGMRQGPINDQQLQALVAQGAITPQTQLETDSGHKGLASQIPGLNFQAPSNPIKSPAPVASSPFPNQGFSTPATSAPNNTSSEALNRQTYILLAMFGGWAGWHCKYAGYQQKQMVHFWLVVIGSILLFAMGLGVILYIVSEIIAVNEMFYENDASGRRMKE